MTELLKPVTRRTRTAYSVLYKTPRHARQIVVTLQPGDLIEFRERGRRCRWRLPIESAFRYAVRRQAFAEMTARREQARSKRRTA